MRPFHLALQLADEASRDPVAAVDNAQKIAALLRREHGAQFGAAVDMGQTTPAPAASQAPQRLLDVLERLDYLIRDQHAQPLAALAVSNILRVPSSRALTQAAPEDGPHNVDWPGGEGYVRSLFAGTLDGNPETLSRVAVKISINGKEELFTTGSAPAYVPLVSLAPGNHNWFRLRDWPVSSLEKWQVSFRYEGVLGGPPQVTPFLLFGYARVRG